MVDFLEQQACQSIDAQIAAAVGSLPNYKAFCPDDSPGIAPARDAVEVGPLRLPATRKSCASRHPSLPVTISAKPIFMLTRRSRLYAGRIGTVFERDRKANSPSRQQPPTRHPYSEFHS
jgi:hypothetical protein